MTPAAAQVRQRPRYPVPIALIGRLAVATQFQGKGLGPILLADACAKVVQAGAVLAVAGIVVDAKDQAAAAFCTDFGFVPLPGRADRFLLPESLLPKDQRRGSGQHSTAQRNSTLLPGLSG